ncbi:MAG TPA: DsbA family protein [Phycisphaerae bacterium]|nr:DsbA family protein [Phycisphaerae bacterium]
MRSASTRFGFSDRLVLHIAVAIVATVGFFSLAGGSCGGNPVTDPNDPNYVGAPGSNPDGNTGGNVDGEKPPLNANDHILGDVNAPVTVIEYADFQCPFCGTFARTEFDTIKANYIDTGRVRWVFRHFPLRNIHDRAEPSARASECAADQGSFYPYLELTFATVNGSNAAILTDSQLQQHAATLGLDTTQFNACFPPGDSKAARVQQDFDSGVALGLTGTPTFFVENERFTGFQTAAQLSAVIERHLNN